MARQAVRAQRKASYLGIMNQNCFVGQEVFELDLGEESKGCWRRAAGCLGVEGEVIIHPQENAGKGAHGSCEVGGRERVCRTQERPV